MEAVSNWSYCSPVVGLGTPSNAVLFHKRGGEIVHFSSMFAVLTTHSVLFSTILLCFSEKLFKTISKRFCQVDSFFQIVFLWSYTFDQNHNLHYKIGPNRSFLQC